MEIYNKEELNKLEQKKLSNTIVLGVDNREVNISELNYLDSIVDEISKHIGSETVLILNNVIILKSKPAITLDELQSDLLDTPKNTTIRLTQDIE